MFWFNDHFYVWKGTESQKVSVFLQDSFSDGFVTLPAIVINQKPHHGQSNFIQ